MKKIISKMFDNWYIYLLIVALSITIWTTIFKNLKEPNKNEKVEITYFGEYLDNKLLKNDLLEMLEKENYSNIKKVSITCHPVSENKYYFKQLLMSRIYQSDLIMIDNNLIDNNFASTYFEPLNVNILNSYSQNITYYKENNKEYGILLDVNENDTFSKYLKNSTYLFVCSNSYNIAKMYGVGNENDDVALKVISYLLKKD